MNLQATNNILIIAPHADDEVLGCGGIMRKMADMGKKVYVLVMTNAAVGAPNIFTEDTIRMIRTEALESHKLLGVTKTYFADFPAPRLDTFPAYELANHIGSVIREVNADTLFIPHRGDVHLDHRRVYEASLVAARPQGVYTVKNIYAYETLSETEWAAPFPEDNFIPNVFVNIEKEIDYKVKAFEKFESQLKIFPHPRSLKGIDVLARHRGTVISVEAAEAFSLIREIIN